MRGKETVVLDLRSRHASLDFFVISTGSNTRRDPRQWPEEVNRVLQGTGLSATGGRRTGARKLDRAGLRRHRPPWSSRRKTAIVVHLEHLWGDAPKIEWPKLILDEAVSA